MRTHICSCEWCLYVEGKGPKPQPSKEQLIVDAHEDILMEVPSDFIKALTDAVSTKEPITDDNGNMWSTGMNNGLLDIEAPANFITHTNNPQFQITSNGVIKGKMPHDKLQVSPDPPCVTGTLPDGCWYSVIVSPTGEPIYHTYDDTPALIMPNGIITYFKHGELHRDEDLGPAMILPGGGCLYYRQGKLHRINGPATITPEGFERFYINGEEDKLRNDIAHLKAMINLHSTPTIKSNTVVQPKKRIDPSAIWYAGICAIGVIVAVGLSIF